MAAEDERFLLLMFRSVSGASVRSHSDRRAYSLHIKRIAKQIHSSVDYAAIYVLVAPATWQSRQASFWQNPCKEIANLANLYPSLSRRASESPNYSRLPPPRGVSCSILLNPGLPPRHSWPAIRHDRLPRSPPPPPLLYIAASPPNFSKGTLHLPPHTHTHQGAERSAPLK